jgi:hypothetical protein
MVTKRRAWTIADVRQIKSLAGKQKAKKIAKKQKRTEGAIWQKTSSMGLSLDMR